MSNSFTYYAESGEIKAFLEDLGFEVNVVHSPEGKEVRFDVLGTTVELGYGVVISGKRYAHGSISIFTILDPSTYTLLDPEKANRSEKLYQTLKWRFGKPPEKNP